jgi:hypothetical protein
MNKPNSHSLKPMHSLLRRMGRDTRYLLVALPLSVASFTVLVTGFAVGLSLAILFVSGALYGTLHLARVFAQVERRAMADVLTRPVPEVFYRQPRPDARWLYRLWYPVTKVQYWLDLLHGILILPFSIAGFVIAVVWWLVAIYGLCYPLFGWILIRIPDFSDIPSALNIGDDLRTRVLFHVALGVAAALTLPLMLRAAALTRAVISRALLISIAPVTPAGPEETPDGARQRLFTLAMDLAEVRRQLEGDLPSSPVTLAEAISQTREGLVELGTLSQGIPPAILTDRGLAPALSALAARAQVPVEIDITTAQRYAPAIENTAYLVVAESLANVALHSQATRVVISLREERGLLLPLVADNGVGGAHAAQGRGLAGLAERLRTMDGDLSVQSPVGGPTVIGAQIPCA